MVPRWTPRRPVVFLLLCSLCSRRGGPGVAAPQCSAGARYLVLALRWLTPRSPLHRALDNGLQAGKGQGKYGKRDRDEEDTKPAIKKPKLQQVVSLGHGWNLNTRHAEQLSALAALITTRKVGFNTTDDKAEVPEDASSSHGLYMEIFDSGIKKMTRYFLWVSNKAKELKIKLELLAVLGASLDLEVKNPMVAFSQGFNDCDKWEGVKSLLFELFGRQDPSCDGVADFLYAFTRTGEKFHMRIYKLKNQEGRMEKRM